MMRWLDGITHSMDMSLSKLWELAGRPGVLQSMGSQRLRHDRATELNTSFHKLVKIIMLGMNVFPSLVIQLAGENVLFL